MSMFFVTALGLVFGRGHCGITRPSPSPLTYTGPKHDFVAGSLVLGVRCYRTNRLLLLTRGIRVAGGRKRILTTATEYAYYYSVCVILPISVIFLDFTTRTG